ncbi:MAG: hypothetical protein VX346_15855, partial [Planctomycetota bacterium]|nr:hypothetical protein [Planctomycetota bacterium]
RWARRGEMIPSRDGDDVTYRFRTYSTFGKKVPEPTGSGSKRRRKNMNRPKMHTAQAAVSRTTHAGPITNIIATVAYVILIVLTAICLMIPLSGLFGLLSGNPDDTTAAVFAIIIGLAISFVPLRITCSVTRDYWKRRRRRRALARGSRSHHDNPVQSPHAP